jgi:hypothetical protein
MAIRTVPGITAADPLFPAIPSQANEEVWAYFFGDATKSANRAIGKSNWTAVSTGPTYSADHATMGNGLGVEFGGLAMTMSNITLMAVCKSTTGGGGTYERIANFEGSLVFWRNVSNNQIIAYGGNGSGYQATLTVDDGGEYKFLAATIGSGGNAKIYNKTDATSSSDGGAATISSGASTYLCLNAATLVGTQTNALDWVWFGAVSAFLTSGEIDEYYDFVKPVILANLGITI